jgi:hypothetical protein
MHFENRRIINALKQFLLAILYKASAELLLVQIQRIVDPSSHLFSVNKIKIKIAQNLHHKQGVEQKMKK